MPADHARSRHVVRGLGAWGYSAEYDPKDPAMFSDRMPITLSRLCLDALSIVCQHAPQGIVTRCALWYNGQQVGALVWYVDRHGHRQCYADCALPNGVVELRTDTGVKLRVGVLVIVQCHVPTMILGDANHIFTSDAFHCDRSVACPREYADNVAAAHVVPNPEYEPIVGAESISHALTLWCGDRCVGFRRAGHAADAFVERAYRRGYLRLYDGKVFVGWIVLWDALCCGWVLLNGDDKESFPIDNSVVQWQW